MTTDTSRTTTLDRSQSSRSRLTKVSLRDRSFQERTRCWASTRIKTWLIDTRRLTNQIFIWGITSQPRRGVNEFKSNTNTAFSSQELTKARKAPNTTSDRRQGPLTDTCRSNYAIMGSHRGSSRQSKLSAIQAWMNRLTLTCVKIRNGKLFKRQSGLTQKAFNTLDSTLTM